MVVLIYFLSCLYSFISWLIFLIVKLSFLSTFCIFNIWFYKFVIFLLSKFLYWILYIICVSVWKNSLINTGTGLGGKFYIVFCTISFQNIYGFFEANHWHYVLFLLSLGWLDSTDSLLMWTSCNFWIRFFFFF